MSERVIPEIRGSVQQPARLAARLLTALVLANQMVLFLLLMGIMAVVAAGIVSRAVFNDSLSWSGELASWTLVWLTFAGMSLGQAQQRHIALNLLGARLGPRAGSVLQAVIDSIVAYTTVMLLFGSLGLIGEIGGTSSGLQWDNRLEYLMVPVTSAFALLFTVPGTSA